jgi:hypothetical protein
MKLRIMSPEIGKIDSVGKINKLKRSGDYVVVTVAVEADPKFDLNTSLALGHKDLIQLMGLFIKNKLLVFLIKGIKNRNNPGPLPKKW